MKEKLSPKGTFHLKIYDKENNLIEEYTEQNLIVTNGKQALAKLIGGDDPGYDKRVTKISFGTDGTPPAAGDTAITSPFTKSIGSATFPDSTSVVFNWSLGYTEANGKAIQEFGLLCIDNTLFARRTRAVINKTSDLRLDGTWKIQF